MEFVKIFGFIIYTLLIWCGSASYWYDKGIRDGEHIE